MALFCLVMVPVIVGIGCPFLIGKVITEPITIIVVPLLGVTLPCPFLIGKVITLVFS